MTYIMNSADIFEEKVQTIEQSEIAVLRDVNRFPFYGKGFASPHMVIGINRNGVATALYDLHEVTFCRNDITVVLPDHLLTQLSCSNDYCTTVVVVARKFLEDLKCRTLSHDYSKFHLTPAYHLTEEQASQVMKAIDMLALISEMSHRELPNRHEMLIYQLDILFELLNAYRREQDKEHSETRENIVFNRFCDLLALHHRTTRDVAKYAEMLHLSPKYFSTVIQKAVGVSASEWIEEYLITQIKLVLTTRSELSVQQVAYEFGFAESASFCRYFKRLTGQTPSQFRKNHASKEIIQ
jgi:AraC-like DNA-binding protein